MERKTKKILVSIRVRGRIYYGLVSASKRGKHYVISSEAYAKLLDFADIKRGQTFTCG